jgi:hypothetical protein
VTAHARPPHCRRCSTIRRSFLPPAPAGRCDHRREPASGTARRGGRAGGGARPCLIARSRTRVGSARLQRQVTQVCSRMAWRPRSRSRSAHWSRTRRPSRSSASSSAPAGPRSLCHLRWTRAPSRSSGAPAASPPSSPSKLIGACGQHAARARQPLHHTYPCLATMNLDPATGDTIMHASLYPVRRCVAEVGSGRQWDWFARVVRTRPHCSTVKAVGRRCLRRSNPSHLLRANRAQPPERHDEHTPQAKGLGRLEQR